jgi:hypothetical protein
VLPEQLSEHGWKADDWTEVEMSVRNAVERHAQVRRVLPRTTATAGCYSIVVPKLARPRDASPLALETDLASAPVSIRCNFKVQSDQLGDRGVVHRLAAHAARTIAYVEDLVLLFGGWLRQEALHSRARVSLRGFHEHRDGVPSGTLGLMTTHPCAAMQAAGDPLALVTHAIAGLQTAVEPYFGPYAVVALGEFWKQMNAPGSQPGSGAPIDRVRATLLGGEAVPVAGPPCSAADPCECFVAGGAAKNTSPLHRALVIAVDSLALELVHLDDAKIALVHYEDGDLVLRVEESFLLRVMDGNAAVTVSLAAAA